MFVLALQQDGTYHVEEVNILDTASFNTITPIVDNGNGIDTFTQASDDAPQIIEYIHDNALDR